MLCFLKMTGRKCKPRFSFSKTTDYLKSIVVILSERAKPCSRRIWLANHVARSLHFGRDDALNGFHRTQEIIHA